MQTGKVKLSITLSRDLVDRIDREAVRGTSRSAVVERWLRLAGRRVAAQAIDDATAAYYGALTAEERDDDDAIARASGRSAKKLAVDDEPRSR